jgi:macrodomain Ter protein organizer (MatP/YcbG family)
LRLKDAQNRPAGACLGAYNGPMNKKTEKVSIYLNPKMKKELASLAKEEYRTLSSVCSYLLKMGLENARFKNFSPGKN